MDPAVAEDVAEAVEVTGAVGSVTELELDSESVVGTTVVVVPSESVDAVTFSSKAAKF